MKIEKDDVNLELLCMGCVLGWYFILKMYMMAAPKVR
jgi:hypothetical protein